MALRWVERGVKVQLQRLYQVLPLQIWKSVLYCFWTCNRTDISASGLLCVRRVTFVKKLPRSYLVKKQSSILFFWLYWLENSWEKCILVTKLNQIDQIVCVCSSQIYCFLSKLLDFLVEFIPGGGILWNECWISRVCGVSVPNSYVAFGTS